MPHRPLHQPVQSSLELRGGVVAESILREVFERGPLPLQGWTFERALENAALRVAMTIQAENLLKHRARK